MKECEGRMIKLNNRPSHSFIIRNSLFDILRFNNIRKLYLLVLCAGLQYLQLATCNLQLGTCDLTLTPCP